MIPQVGPSKLQHRGQGEFQNPLSSVMAIVQPPKDAKNLTQTEGSGFPPPARLPAYHQETCHCWQPERVPHGATWSNDASALEPQRHSWVWLCPGSLETIPSSSEFRAAGSWFVDVDIGQVFFFFGWRFYLLRSFWVDMMENSYPTPTG